MKKGIAYVLVVIATACECFARYLVKGRISEEKRQIKVNFTDEKREVQVFVAPKWLH